MTGLLQAWQAGDGKAYAEVFDIAYDRLKQIAAQRLREVAGDSTMSPTELLHESVLRIADAPKDWKNRAHFFASMSLYIRATLVDHARARAAQKRGGHQLHITLTGANLGEDSPVLELIALDQALTALEKVDQRGSEVLHLTYFAGLPQEEIAAVLGISLSTVERELRFAKAWLHNTLGYGI
jgi:RNA polymerase sigma factor (TIGR02999 family)